MNVTNPVHSAPEEAKRQLICLLRAAYSGELAAAIAYQGHWRSVKDPDERAAIQLIEQDEWHHRRRVGEMLAELGSAPSWLLETRLRLVGLMINGLCRIGGWYVPMYGAGRIERRNIVEYEDAAKLAVLAGLDRYVNDLLQMAEVEWDHERYFREKAAHHVLQRLLPLWPAPLPKQEIRNSLAAFREALGR